MLTGGETVLIVTEDGVQFQVDKRCINQMGALNFFVESESDDSNNNNNNNNTNSKTFPLQIPNVKSNIFSKILEYLNFHMEDPLETTPASRKKEGRDSVRGPQADDPDGDLENLPQTSSSDDSSSSVDEEYLYEDYLTNVNPWDQKFMESLELQTLLEMTKAVNFLNMPRLLDLCCRTIAKHMTGLKTEELRKKFNLPNDLTPEQEAKLAAEFSWIDE